MFILRQVPRFVLVIATMLFMSCGSWINRNTMTGPCNPTANPQAPIVCVDISGPKAMPTPDPVTANDKMQSSKAPVTVQWFAPAGSDLHIEMKQPGCVSNIRCDGHGHCSAQTMPGSVGQCKYDVWTTPENRNDPIIIITNCC